MRNLLKFIWVIALVAIMLPVTSCVTTTSIDGTADMHGFISSLFPATKAASAEGTKIASYWVIIGLFDLDYPAYVDKVKAAVRQGRKITTTTAHYFGIVSVITAYY
jgi:hypothetical protein